VSANMRRLEAYTTRSIDANQLSRYRDSSSLCAPPPPQASDASSKIMEERIKQAVAEGLRARAQENKKVSPRICTAKQV
jgi:hypothetical protein